ncbi:MAG: hypothetical protein ACOY46_19430 [Bacillota bacterium]
MKKLHAAIFVVLLLIAVWAAPVTYNKFNAMYAGKQTPVYGGDGIDHASHHGGDWPR